MKYWIVTNAYLPEKGGLVSYARNVALELSKQGKSVEIITSNMKNNNLLEHEVIEGINVNRIDYSNVPKMLRPFSPLVYYYKTLKYLKQSDIRSEDIVISRFYTFALAVAKAKNIKRHIFITPLVATKMQLIEAKEAKGLRRFYLFFILPQLSLLDRNAIKLSPYIGVLSKSKKSEIVNHYKINENNVFVTPPGVDIDRFKIPELSEKNTIREKYGYKSTDKIVLSVSRLSSEKNLEVIIHSFDLLKADNFRLAIVGDGESKKRLESLIYKYNLKDKVILWGARQNVEEFYKMADLFILPSKYEGFGHVYIEALSCGLPCIASKPSLPEVITASDEIIINEKLGRLITYNNPKEIASAILSNINSSEDDKEYRRKYVVKNYTWTSHLKTIDTIVNKSQY